VGGSAGVGGSTGAGGTAGAGGATGAGGDCGLVIDNMEAATGLICQGSGRIGHWFAYNDQLTGTVQTPPRLVAPTRPDPIQPARGTSAYAMHTYGTFSSFLGLGTSLNGSLSDTPEIPRTYDMSGYTGISFYAKGTPSTIQFIIATSENVPPAYGGTCSTATCNSNRKDITLSSSWTFYPIPFNQVGLGTNPLNLAHVLTINFQAQGTGVSASADFWIDDVQFY
jgi:hypothetical protein